jgi:hypothetical protein
LVAKKKLIPPINITISKEEVNYQNYLPQEMDAAIKKQSKIIKAITSNKV